jgi:DNA-binding CsgD family transcriptional regulator
MTEREQSVVNLLLAGHTVSEAAERLGLTYYAADHASRRAMVRVGARSREELMRAHGVNGRVPHARRTPLDIQRAIAVRRAAGEKLESLAREFGKDVSTIHRIYKREMVREANEEADRMLREDAGRAV